MPCHEEQDQARTEVMRVDRILGICLRKYPSIWGSSLRLQCCKLLEQTIRCVAQHPSDSEKKKKMRVLTLGRKL